MRVLTAILFVVFSITAHSQTVMNAVTKGDTVLLRKLIAEGQPVNVSDDNGSTPLMTACRWADEPVVRILLQNGATPDHPKSPKGRTALMVACAYYSGKTICRMLIEKGASVNAHSDDGATPLMLAALNGKLDVVDLLLAKGADATLKDNKGKTALDYAVNAEILEWTINSIKDTRIDKEAVIARLKEALAGTPAR